MVNFVEAPGKKCPKCGEDRLLIGNGGPLSFHCASCEATRKAPPPPVNLDHVKDTLVVTSDGSLEVSVEGAHSLPRIPDGGQSAVLKTRVDSTTLPALDLIERGLDNLSVPDDIKVFRKILKMKQLLKDLKEVYNV